MRRQPAEFAWKRRSDRSSRVSEPVTSSDLYPTCLAVAGQPLRPHQHRDGMNLKPLLKGKDSLGREAIFWHYPHYNRHPSSVLSSVIRKGAWKLIETFDPEGIELHNLEEDLRARNLTDSLRQFDVLSSVFLFLRFKSWNEGAC